MGKLRFFLIHKNGIYKYYSKKDRAITFTKTENCNIDSYEYSFVLDIFNDSDSHKIMRDIKVNVYRGKESLGEVQIQNKDITKVEMKSITQDVLTTYNFSPKECARFNLMVILPTEIAMQLKSGLSLKLCYKNEKNNTKYFEIFNEKNNESPFAF